MGIKTPPDDPSPEQGVGNERCVWTRTGDVEADGNERVLAGMVGNVRWKRMGSMEMSRKAVPNG